MFLRLRSADATCTLNAGSGLVVDVADRHGRRGLAQRLATKLCGVLPLTRHRLLGTEPSFEVVPTPGCDDGADAIILVLGLLSARVAEAAGLRPMAATAATFVQDVRLAAADAFADANTTTVANALNILSDIGYIRKDPPPPTKNN